MINFHMPNLFNVIKHNNDILDPAIVLQQVNILNWKTMRSPELKGFVV